MVIKLIPNIMNPNVPKLDASTPLAFGSRPCIALATMNGDSEVTLPVIEFITCP